MPYKGYQHTRRPLDTLIAVPPAPVRLISYELYLYMFRANRESALHLCWGAKGVGSPWRVWRVSQMMSPSCRNGCPGLVNNIYVSYITTFEFHISGKDKARSSHVCAMLSDKGA